jgi:hypothetical protein
MRQQAHFQMPYLLAGEILDTNKEGEKLTAITDKGFDEKNKPAGEERAVGYSVLVTFPNGSQTLFSNVVQACSFGGIGDFFQSKLRASKDVLHKFPEKAADLKDIVSIGSRVLVAFVGGDMRKPVIVAHLPHPNRAFDLPDKTKNEPQAKFSYKGLEIQVNYKGEVITTSRGSPTESDGSSETTKAYERKDVGAVDLPDRETNAPLPSTALVPNMPPKLLSKASSEMPTENKKLKYPDKKYTTESGFLELGEWYVVDSEGQTIFLDRDSKTLTLTNGTETIQFDKEHKKLFVQSSGDLEVTTQNDYCTSVMGAKHQTISKNEWYAVKGDEFRSVGGSRTSNVVDKDVTKIGTSWVIEVGSAESVAGGSGKSGDKHRAGIKLSTGNSFTIDDDEIKIVHKSGALISMDKDGKVTITTKKDVSVTAENVTVTSKKADIKADEITLGKESSFAAVLGENLCEWLDKHIHPTGTGPSGPPAVLTSATKGSAKDIVSAKVKLMK